MGTSAGPNLAGIGRGGASNLVLEMDAHDAKSYPGEPTTNLFPQPSLASASVGTTWSGNGGTWGTSTATVESVMGPDGKYIKAVSNQHTASGGGTAHIWFFYNYLSGMGSAQRDLTLTNGTAYTCSWWWKANESRTTIGNNIYFVGVANVSTGASNIVTTEWTRVSVSFTFGGTTGTYNPGHYFYNVGDSTAVGFKVWYAMLQIEEKTYATPAVRSQLSGFGQQGYNARPASINLMIHGNVGTGQNIYDSSPSKHTITANGNTTHSAAQSKFSGGSVYFDGTGDYLSVPDHADWAFGTGNFTVDCWLYKNATVAWETMFDTYSYAVNGFICGLKDSDSTIAFYSENGTGWNYAGGTVLALNTWYHLAWVRDGNNFRMFVNGTQQGSTFTFSSSDNYTSATLLVGSRNGAQYINGYMDEMRITKGTALWTSAFTPPTRRNLSAPVVDRSGNHNGGNFATTDMTDVATYRVGEVIRPIDSAVWDFDGTDDKISCKSPSFASDLVGAISVWARPEGLGDSLVCYSNPSTGVVDEMRLGYYTNNKVQFVIYQNGTGDLGFTTDADAISLNQWQHIVIVNDGNNMYIYVNGEMVKSDPDTYWFGDLTTDADTFTIGDLERSGTLYQFDGKIGNLAVYSAPLTAQQVKENFYQQSSRFNVPNWSNRDIVQRGLIRWLDFGEAACYPGGTIGTVNDLKTGTAYTVSNSGGGITYSGDGGGCFAFAGTTDDKIPFTWTEDLPACTVSVWVYNISGGDTRQTLFGHYFELLADRLQMYSYNFTALGWRFSTVGSVPYNTWTNAVMTWDGTNVKAYINGAHNYTNTVGAGGDAGGFYEISVSWARLKAKLATGLIYDRALSASELEQNFIVQKQRFGV